MSKERLVELIKRDNCQYPCLCSSKCKYVDEDDCHSERLADLILADGWIRLPCKVGDEVYYFHPMKDNRLLPFINTAKIKRIEITKKTTKFFYSENKYFAVTEFDKTVFLSKEKAEAKLKEGAE